MKKTTLRFQPFILTFAVVAGFSSLTLAQQPVVPPVNEVHVKIIERSGGTVTELNRTYRADGMTNARRDELVKGLVDSLKAAHPGVARDRQLTIIIDDTEGKSQRSQRPDVYSRRNHSIGPIGPDHWNQSAFDLGKLDSLKENMRSMADRMNRYQFSMPRDWQSKLTAPFENWSRESGVKASTVRNLDVYPNNPDHKLLNVRFTAPAKGHVSIVVTNPKGKEVARSEVKEFSGEYVGQIDLGKSAPDTYFITVTQNEDGAVKRIVVPE